MSENNTEMMTEEVVEEVVEEVQEDTPTTDSLAALHAEEDAKNKKWKEIWDKITTGILIFLMASPFLILIYLLTWFMNK